MFRLVKILMVLVVICGLGALGAGVMLLQDSPGVKASPPPTAEDVAATRQLVRELRAAAGATPGQQDVLFTTVPQLNSAVRLGARFINGFRARVGVQEGVLTGRASVPVPWWNGRKWLNVAGTVPEFEGALQLNRVVVGGVDLPPALVLSAARIGANLWMGNQFGDKVVTAASAMRITDSEVAFQIALGDVGRNGVLRSAFGALRNAEMPEPKEIRTYYRMIRKAMDDGTLPTTGSFLPYLQFTLVAALDGSTAETLPNAYTAAIFGLAKACSSAKDFAMIVGRVAFNEEDEQPKGKWRTTCNAMTLNGRTDSREHFIVSAALQAASNRGFAVSVGEFKELYDTISGSGGFDFTDMAANLSGVALSNALMAQPPAAWPDLLVQIRTERDVIVPFNGIPGKTPEAEFKAQYGDVESVAYKEMIARIEGRIDELSLYQGQ